jgi:hypothetical protein
MMYVPWFEPVQLRLGLKSSEPAFCHSGDIPVANTAAVDPFVGKELA